MRQQSCGRPSRPTSGTDSISSVRRRAGPACSRSSGSSGSTLRNHPASSLASTRGASAPQSAAMRPCAPSGLAPNKDKRDALYLTQVTSVRLELPEVIAAIRSEIERDRPALVVLDERRAGIGVVQHLKRDGDRSTWLSNCNDTAPSAPSCALRLLVAVFSARGTTGLPRDVLHFSAGTRRTEVIALRGCRPGHACWAAPEARRL